MRLLFVIVWVLFSWPVSAESTNVEPLTTLDDGRDWSAVGRLTINGGEGFCTASLITPTLLITAAHCLFDPDTEQRLDVADMEFQAGFRNGRAEAYRKVRLALPHPNYKYQPQVTVDRVMSDLALLELVTPIKSTKIKPFQISNIPPVGQNVSVVSYARGRSEIPSYQRICEIFERQQDMLIMTCDVDFGASGSPVFDFSLGYPRIVSVVSAMAKFKGNKVSLGAALTPLLTGFADEFSLRVDPFTGAVTQEFTPTHRREIGAKFSKP